MACQSLCQILHHMKGNGVTIRPKNRDRFYDAAIVGRPHAVRM